jgi:hypothetical protein
LDGRIFHSGPVPAESVAMKQQALLDLADTTIQNDKSKSCALEKAITILSYPRTILTIGCFVHI